jgi:type I restriction enzyme S subunit
LALARIRDFAFPCPNSAEQQKIAAILTAVDDKLDLIVRQISATQTLKQGLMQTLFTRGAGTPDAQGRWHPHTAFQDTELGRIPVPWTMRRLGDVAPLIRRPVEIDTSLSYPELGLRSYGKGTFHKPALLGSMVGNKRLFEIKAGDLLLSNVFAWEGAVAVANPEDDGRFGSHRYITCKVDAALADTRYICRYLVTPAGTDKLSLASPGGAGRNKTLGLGALADIEIPCPSIEEQRKITMVLDSVDDKLTTLTTQQTHYQSLKRGLMQKLLTGQWRVRVDAAALAPVNEEAPA